MIARDRELLARLSQVNHRLGEAVVDLMARQDDGQLPAEGLRALADTFTDASADLRRRAAEIDSGPSPTLARAIIDARH